MKSVFHRALLFSGVLQSQERSLLHIDEKKLTYIYLKDKKPLKPHLHDEHRYPDTKLLDKLAIVPEWPTLYHLHNRIR